ncbi:MAG: YCII-related protein [Myxococcales bacterium]|nr:YCII-related protein [Myxococcales bacterium]
MRFLMTYNADDHSPPTPEKMTALGRFSEEMAKSGVLLDTGGILPSSKGAKVRRTSGKFTVTDGPFPETKELVVGYAIIQVKTKDEAIEVARRFMNVAGDGEGEIRQLMGASDGPHH